MNGTQVRNYFTTKVEKSARYAVAFAKNIAQFMKNECEMAPVEEAHPNEANFVNYFF